MSTIKKLTENKIMLSKETVTEKHLYDIIATIVGDGGAKIFFSPFSKDVEKKGAEYIGQVLPDGFDKYLILIDDKIEIFYTSEISKIYAMYDIKKNYNEGIGKGAIYGRAVAKFRGYRTYLPAREKMEQFKAQIEMLLELGYNKLTLELGGAAEYKSHPEINEGWVEYCKIFSEYSGKTLDAQRMYKFPKNSIHMENGGGNYLKEEELIEIKEYCEERHIEIIPEMPCLSHSDYLLYNHPEFAEDKEDILPDVACPSNDDYYKMLFDIFDDMIRVFKPHRINIGHDELYVTRQCEKCKSKTAAQLFCEDVTKIRNFLKSRGVETMLWGDKVIKAWHGGSAAIHVRQKADGKKITYHGHEREVGKFFCTSIPEFLEYVKDNNNVEGWYVEETASCSSNLPKDLQISDWSAYEGEWVEDEYERLGYRTIFGNCSPVEFEDIRRRMNKEIIDGFSVSNWGMSDMVSQQRAFYLFRLFAGSVVSWDLEYDYTLLKENILYICQKLFEYINKDILRGDYIEINHSCDFDIPHDNFDSGHWVVREKFHIADYEIEFENGNNITYPVVWGENIGPGLTGEKLTDQAEKNANRKLLEACGISLPFYKETGDIYYKILLQSNSKIKNLRVIKTEKCVGNIITEY